MRILLLAAVVGLLGCATEGFDARRETVNGYTVVWLGGSPYDMGFQQGSLLRDELKGGLVELEENFVLKSTYLLAQSMGLTELARDRSYPEILEECEGLADGFGDAGWTMDHCMLLNFGDVLVEFVRTGLPEAEDLAPGCTQVVARGEATADGRLYHARVLDWSRIEYIIENPVIFVRQPEGGVPHVVVGFPANLSPYQGMNAEGVVIASNEVHPLDNTVNDQTGRSHVQLISRLLGAARSLGEVRTMVTQANHMSLELVTVSDGDAGTAEVLEMAPRHVGVLTMKDGVVRATNHFQEAKCATMDKEPIPEGSSLRMQRLDQLLSPGGAQSLHGKLSPQTLVQLMRDRVDPTTGIESPADEFDDAKSIATNGALYQLVFDPARRLFWLAAGKIPVPAQPFTGFSLGALLGEEDALDHPATIP